MDQIRCLEADFLIWCNYPGNCDGMNMRDQSGSTGGGCV